jgi:hypothetical protein
MLRFHVATKLNETQPIPLRNIIQQNSTKSVEWAKNSTNLYIFSRSAAEVYPLWYRSVDFSTDPGLMSHFITCT